jgi:hypothetical protein
LPSSSSSPSLARIINPIIADTPTQCQRLEQQTH